MDARGVVLVEGTSDRNAVLALAERRGVDLEGEGVTVVSIGGAQAIGRFLDRYGPSGQNLRVAGLCDAQEERYYRRALERAGLGSDLDRAAMERLGFFVCDANLEDELIRAIGVRAVLDVLEQHGDLESFRTFQKQPQWRGRDPEAQLRRYLHSADRRNTRYPPLFIDVLESGQSVRPLDGVLAHLTRR